MEALADHLAGWQPEAETVADALAPGPSAALAAVFDVPDSAPHVREALPPLWHWLHFLDSPPQRELGPDGHPRHGRFLPPIPRRTRMFAGGRLTVDRPVVLGRVAERRTGLAGAAVKQGRSGELAFVTVRHEVWQDGRLCVVEEQDLVYRSGPAARAPSEAGKERATAAAVQAGEAVPRTPVPLWTLTPGPVLLFRFSALTANAHRIHYDADYARDVEGYPGLVVHGPLLALAMLEPLRRHHPERRIGSVRFRLERPVFADTQVAVVEESNDGSAARFAVHTAPGTEDGYRAAWAEVGWR